MSIWIIFKIIGSLALLIYGMKVMSEALQKMAGSQLRHILGTMTKNRFTGLITGMFVTASVQSSTATTVMTVSFVNAGLLTLAQAISVIMGANIGTTFTAWIMTLGFSFNMANVVFPVFFIALLLIYRKKHRYVGDFLFGVAFMFFAISTLGATGKEMDLSHNQSVIEFFSSFDKDSYLTIFAFLGLGTILTFCMQSSAALMAITMVLCSSGVLPIYMGIALVLGENIGTTITSNIAAMGANTQARRAAMAHLSFNVFGVLWVLCIFYPFIDMVCGFVGVDPHSGHIDASRLSVVLAAFHTTFNVCNTAVLIWFIPQMEKLVCTIIKPNAMKDEDDFRLRYIGDNTLMATPELSVLEARKEIQSFAERIQRMFSMVRELLGVKNENDFVKLFTRIEKYEGISDNMEIEIANYLDKVSDSHLSDETKAKIRAMLREISEIESIGDSCYNIARTLNRKLRGKEDFTEQQYDHLHQMFELTDDSLTQMNVMLSSRRYDLDVNRSFNIENEINNYRTQLKSQNINDVNNHLYTYAIGTMYMDIVSECEILAGSVISVVEARMGTKQREA
ncbi:MAG: Na/Pi cotransporter family protein [Prevotella pectinovora]